MNSSTHGAAETIQESAEAIRRLRAGFAIVFAVQILNVIADFSVKPEFASGFTFVHALMIVLLFGTFALSATAWFARHWEFITWLVCTLLLAAGTLMSVVSHDVIPRFVSVLVFSLGCATFLPWGRFWQGLLNLVCVISFATDIALVGEPSPYGAYLWVGLFASVTLGQFVAGFAERYRRVLFLSAREQAARAEAEAASRNKDEFLAMLGHELRNPLAAIALALGLTRTRGKDLGGRELTIVERQVKHLLRLIDDLLDVSRISRGGIELKKERLEVADVVTRAIEMTSSFLEQRGQTLSVEVPGHGLAVDGDPTRLAQVFFNLLTNAAKYTETGGQISVTAARDGDDVAVRLRDTGIGIEPQMLGKVFDLFVQDYRALERSQGGLGLGLTIVKSLVTMHGGTVTVFSEGRGRGSEFTVRLPAAAGRDEAAIPAANPAQPPGAKADGGGGHRVLVVDDNRDAAETLARWLETNGHHTRIAHDGAAALRMVGEFGPDVALLEVKMEVMDGYELARRFREHPALAQVRLVAVTGHGQELDRERSAAAGFDAHLVKPVDVELLESLIRRLVKCGGRRESSP
jgi:signal transduction histidine kinase/CheY-like chemotaxis protein